MSEERTMLEVAEGTVALPDWLRNDEPGNAVAVQQRNAMPFVHIAQPKSTDFWTKIASKFPGVQEGHQFLFTPGGEIFNLTPMRFSLLLARQFWVRTAPNGDVVECSAKAMPKPFRERIITAIAVYRENDVTLATCEWRSTKVSAIHQMSKRLEEAREASWGERSPAHALTMQLPKAFMRFFGVMRLGNRTAKKGGFPYVFTAVETQPTTAVEWTQLARFVQDEDCIKQLTAIGDQFAREVREYESKVA